MGRRRQNNWTELGSTNSHSTSSRQEQLWEAYVRYDTSYQAFNVSMAGWGMTDQGIEKWCAWFRSHIERLPASKRSADQIWASEVNFAENDLTSAGVRCLLETLTATKVAVAVLKLHHNQLTSGSSVAEYIMKSHGTLRELHLSHNELETDAAAEIVLAAAAAADSHGRFYYPSHEGHSAAPLWLRLEQNYVDATGLAQQADAQSEIIRPGKVLCNVSSRACTPHCCVKHRHDPPPVHAKHLGNQRNQLPGSRPMQPSTAQDLLSLLKSGKVNEDRCSSDRPAPQKSESEAEMEGPREEAVSNECIVADVLRWDEEKLRWVKDVLEIPPLEPHANEGSGRVKLSEEIGNKLGDALKNMIGCSKSQEQKELSTPTRRFSKPAISSYADEPSRHSISLSEAEITRSRVLDDELPKTVSPTSRRSRRGSQPTGSEVKQTNSFTLNPQAKEFYPSMSRVPPKVHELNLQAFLDPEVDDLTPSNSTSAAEFASPMVEASECTARPEPFILEGKVPSEPSLPSSLDDKADTLSPSTSSSEAAGSSEQSASIPSLKSGDDADGAEDPAPEEQRKTENHEWSFSRMFSSFLGLSSSSSKSKRSE